LNTGRGTAVVGSSRAPTRSVGRFR
jgi:hypothetical protein